MRKEDYSRRGEEVLKSREEGWGAGWNRVKNREHRGSGGRGLKARLRGRDVMKPRRECVLCSGSTSGDVFLPPPPPPATHISPPPSVSRRREHVRPAIVSHQGLSFTLIKAFSRTKMLRAISDTHTNKYMLTLTHSRTTSWEFFFAVRSHSVCTHWANPHTESRSAAVQWENVHVSSLIRSKA